MSLLSRCCLLLALFSATLPADEPQAPDINSLYQAKTFKSPKSEPAELNYRLLIPENYDRTQDTQFPLVLFLHGAGERGADNTRQLRHAASEFAKPEHRKKYPCFVAAPQCPDGRWWTDSLDLVTELLTQLRNDYRIDTRRVYVTGLSMGGFGTFELATRSPELFAAAAPICGGGDPTRAKALADLPLWVFHGDADRIVPVGLSRTMVKSVTEAGGMPKYTEYPGVGHDSWTKTYSDPAFHDWLFAQRKPATPNPDTTTETNK
jgi:predicted peptidase